ncbi:MAG: Asp-tRNA(Asn)/Glu-tRNA(Gln) amidotransferase subunit GatB [Candidatus Berkelbacteria bacterium]|nr:Asp-tRNA(Asn)/Glu-tRNA(Gln) amidotransferase subunit GatB [Candidatus Berkelbacteria bacterium]
MSEFTTKIGLEIHVQLKTKSKMFCGCNNISDGAEPNTLVCPICLGMPGTLPVANRQAIELTIKTGIALGSEIPPLSKFDRKHYFYPDLPKGFQISQYDQPLCLGGKVEVQNSKSEALNKSEIQNPNGEKENGIHTIRLNRIHLEEDAGKLTHPSRERAEASPAGKNYSLVDLNRAGTPLMEIVTEPDIVSPAEARKFLEELQLTLRYLGVSDADMEKGQLRCDANISINQKSKIKDQNDKFKFKMSPITEIKNLNSFKFVEQALAFEEKRIAADFENWPQKLTKITRGFDSQKGISYEQRRKEEAADYRYFPEPDVPPIKMTKDQIAKIKNQIVEMPKAKHQRYIAAGIRPDVAEKIIRRPQITEYLESAGELKKELAVFIAEEVKHSDKLLPIADVSELLNFVSAGIISKTVAKGIYHEMETSGKKSAEIIKEKNLEQVSDAGEIESIMNQVLKENPDLLKRYQSGKIELEGFFVGQIMRQSGGKANPQLVRRILKEKLNGKINS